MGLATITYLQWQLCKALALAYLGNISMGRPREWVFYNSVDPLEGFDCSYQAHQLFFWEKNNVVDLTSERNPMKDVTWKNIKESNEMMPKIHLGIKCVSRWVQTLFKIEVRDLNQQNNLDFHCQIYKSPSKFSTITYFESNWSIYITSVCDYLSMWPFNSNWILISNHYSSQMLSSKHPGYESFLSMKTRAKNSMIYQLSLSKYFHSKIIRLYASYKRLQIKKNLDSGWAGKNNKKNHSLVARFSRFKMDLKGKIEKGGCFLNPLLKS